MALVKTSKIGAGSVKPKSPAASAAPAKAPPRGGRSALPASASRQEKAAERVAAATEELASGLVQASAAAEELQSSMQQIASGAEEAAGASQEQLAAIKEMVSSLTAARGEADQSFRRTEAVQVVLAETSTQINSSVRAIERNAERQQASVKIIAELELRAQDIGEISRTVSRISDQTNLLALNAAIEAARAGDHGRGFAVVAEEVRALAETSEKSAQDVQSLAETIQDQVRDVVGAVSAASEKAVVEARAGIGVVQTLEAMRHGMASLSQGSQTILTAAIEAESAASEAQRGAEQVAGAAEEQSAGASEAQSAIREQAQSLEQGQIAARSLAELAESLRNGGADTASAEQIAAAAEELSATIQEMSGAATEIMAAVEQINRGSQQQAAATQQTSAAMTQIEKSANLAKETAATASGQVKTMQGALKESRTAVEGLIGGVGDALSGTRATLDMIAGLETVARRIDKIVDGIALVAVQTSMLAVSGAVEAARAGDAGRGFSVVSGDIRNLAREASESADRVKDTVRSISDQIGSVRRDLEQIVDRAETEVEANQGLFGSLEAIEREVTALAGASATIVRGADTIMLAVGQTAAGARQIAAAAEEASAASRQAAQASIEQARGAEDLAAAIEEIASLADELKSANG
ncbi:MAG: methyl-accepting chemotaxis protein [Caulobacteraceae bacterium]